AAAVAAAQVTTNRDAALLTGIGAALGEGRIDREAMAAQLRQTVLLLVTRIVGDVGVAADRLAARVDVAADLLSDAAESAMLRVHPDDVALLDGRLPATIFPIGDASVSRGSFVLESASTVVEDGPALWMEQLAAAIDRVPLPC
ncbi:MAG: flagellar biosynthesis protein FliH, partial [Sphingomonas sp.]